MFFGLICLEFPIKFHRKSPHILDRQREKSYDKYDKIIADLKAQADSCADEAQKQALLASAAELEKVAAEQEKSVAAMKDVTKSDGAWKKGADQVSNGVAQYTGGVQKLSESSSTLTSADSEISKGLTSLVTSAKTFAKQQETFECFEED